MLCEKPESAFRRRLFACDEMGKNESYQEFVEKFKPKKTTDDCYTPYYVYDAVADWVSQKYSVNKSRMVRPFYPGGDYENYTYFEGDVVVDNPPFSVMSEIVKFYLKRNIRFFLFAPYLTILGTIRAAALEACAVITGSDVVYENGAKVKTSFVTNLEDEYIAIAEPELAGKIKEAVRKSKNKNIPKYIYPDEVLTATMLGRMASSGTRYAVKRGQALSIRGFDDQRTQHKGAFGSALLLSEEAKAEKIAAEKIAAEKIVAEKEETRRVYMWRLSERERSLIAQLGKNENCAGAREL